MLTSWNDGAARSMIVDFVARVTREGGPEYVRPAERIATFENDGTLRCEQPVQVQVLPHGGLTDEELDVIATTGRSA